MPGRQWIRSNASILGYCRSRRRWRRTCKVLGRNKNDQRITCPALDICPNLHCSEGSIYHLPTCGRILLAKRPAVHITRLFYTHLLYIYCHIDVEDCYNIMEDRSLNYPKLSTISVSNYFWDSGIYYTLWAELDFNNSINTHITIIQL